MKKPFLASLFLFLVSPCFAQVQAHHFYKEKRWWAGEAVILGTMLTVGLAENHAKQGGTNAFGACGTCTTSKDVALISGIGAAAFTGEHAFAHWAFWSSDEPLSKPWAILAYGETPVSAAAILLPQAAGNLNDSHPKVKLRIELLWLRRQR